MCNYLNSIPCGKSIPLNNPHAVSVSLPTIQNVIDYEESKPELLNKLESGYPRFFQNHFITKLTAYIQSHIVKDNTKTLLLVNSELSINIIKLKIHEPIEVLTFENILVLIIDHKEQTIINKVKWIIQHYGLIVSSRQAEHILIKHGQITKPFNEPLLNKKDARFQVQNVLSEHYNTHFKNIYLCNNGMNAVSNSIHTTHTWRKQQGKNKIVQIGWLYVDTIQVLQELSEDSNDYYYFNANNKHAYIQFINEYQQEISLVFCELISNPTLFCLDIIELHDISKKSEIPLIVDITMATPIAINILPHCDIAIESLTKFASGSADVMMGAVVLNPDSIFYTIIQNNIKAHLETPFINDIKRLGYCITNYDLRMQRIAENTTQLLEYFKNKDYIKTLYYTDLSSKELKQIAKSSNIIPGLISIIFKQDINIYYDKITLAKGPSLGTDFTLLMPYTYLAHYNDINDGEKYTILLENGIDKNLLRISVGQEPIEYLIAAFDTL